MINYSQSNQDLFVLKMLNNKRNGFYLEIGGSDPIQINNTYLLEKDYDWKGVSIEIDTELSNKFNSIRKNLCHNTSALIFDYKREISKITSDTQIDYLSLDIEPARQSLECLKQLPHETYRFSVITFEHELYREGPEARDECRRFLSDLGYQIVVADVKNQGNPYEDWWIDPNVVSEDTWRQFFQSNVEHSQLSL
jgi:hypothetical protein